MTVRRREKSTFEKLTSLALAFLYKSDKLKPEPFRSLIIDINALIIVSSQPVIKLNIDHFPDNLRFQSPSALPPSLAE